MKIALLSFLLAAVPAAAFESALAVDPQTTRVDSADRLDETLEQVANSVTVIAEAEIELRGRPSVADLLRTAPGVDVIRTGGAGGTTTAFIRGDDSSHTLVLLDGIPLNDASNTARFYDFANMTTDNVERIEILRGPQSVLYGSDAIGGVINIVTKKGAGPLKGSVSGEWGSYNTNVYRAELNGGTRYVDYAAAGSREATGSIPAAASDAGNTIRDPYRATTISGSVGLKPLENVRLDLNARNAHSFYHLASSGGPGGDDPSYTGRFDETDLAAKATWISLNGRLTHKLFTGATTTSRLFLDDFSAINPQSRSNNGTYGQTLKSGYQAVARLADWNTLTAGVEAQDERTHQSYTSVSSYGPYDSIMDNRTNRSKSGFAEELLKYDGRYFISVGGRRDLNKEFGGANTYRISPTALIPETSTKLKASAGTGFKAPSLYQLYSQYGDAGLRAEQSRAWDAGFEQDLFDRTVSFGATYFHSNVSNLIAFNNATSIYYNVGRTRSEGCEVTVQAVPSARLTVKGNYTYTSTHDLTDDTELPRRPAIKFGGDVEVRPVDGASFLVGAAYTGPARDTNYSVSPSRPVTLGGYALWHAAGSYALNPHLTFTARIDNMFNKRYELVEGYGTLGIAGYGGVKLSF